MNYDIDYCVNCRAEHTYMCGKPCSECGGTTFTKDAFTNPVHKHGGLWYFWDETWADKYGPYETEEAAAQACKKYTEKL